MTQATCADSTGALVAHPLAGAAPPGSPAPSPHRRGLLAGAAAALAAAPFAASHAAQLRAVGALARDAGPDAELIRVGDAIMANAAEVTRLGDEGDALPYPEVWRFHEQKVRPLVADSWAMRMRMAQMQATTPDGFRAKARVLQEYSNCSARYAEADHDDALGWSLANDLLGVPSVWKAEGDGEGEA